MYPLPIFSLTLTVHCQMMDLGPDHSKSYYRWKVALPLHLDLTHTARTNTGCDFNRYVLLLADLEDDSCAPWTDNDKFVAECHFGVTHTHTVLLLRARWPLGKHLRMPVAWC